MPLIETGEIFEQPTSLLEKSGFFGLCWRFSPVCPLTETPISFPTVFLVVISELYSVSLFSVVVDYFVCDYPPVLSFSLSFLFVSYFILSFGTLGPLVS